MSKEPAEYLKHIRDESGYLLSLTEKGLTREQLFEDDTLKRAVVRSLEVIGEQPKRYPQTSRLSGRR